MKYTCTHALLCAHTYTHTQLASLSFRLRLHKAIFKVAFTTMTRTAFEVAEVKEQTTAQAKKEVLALTPSPLFGDIVCAGRVLKRHVFHGE